MDVNSRVLEPRGLEKVAKLKEKVNSKQDS